MLKNFFVTVLILILLGASVFFGLTSFKSKERTIEHDGRLRRFRLHIPKGYFEKDTYPLLIALHGFSENPRIMEIVTGLSRKADEEGFFVAYPYGTHQKKFTPYSWNSEFCCGYALQQGVDDVGFIGKVIDDVAEEYSIDKDLVYVVGFSNGAMMTQQVALKMPEKVKAIAVVSGAVGGMHEDAEEFEWLDQSGVPVPVVIFHGREDVVIPFEGGEGGAQVFEFKGAYDVVNLWLQNNRCSVHPTQIHKVDTYTKEVYADCESGSEVVFYSLDSKHVWPGGLQEIVRKFSGRGVRATDAIWEFFTDL